MNTRDTFEFSGDYEWARWRRGVMCALCLGNDGTMAKAIGLAVEVVTRLDDSSVEVTPVCEACAKGTLNYTNKTIHTKTIVMFEDEEDN